MATYTIGSGGFATMQALFNDSGFQADAGAVIVEVEAGLWPMGIGVSTSTLAASSLAFRPKAGVSHGGNIGSGPGFVAQTSTDSFTHNKAGVTLTWDDLEFDGGANDMGGYMFRTNNATAIAIIERSIFHNAVSNTCYGVQNGSGSITLRNVAVFNMVGAVTGAGVYSGSNPIIAENCCVHGIGPGTNAYGFRTGASNLTVRNCIVTGLNGSSVNRAFHDTGSPTKVTCFSEDYESASNGNTLATATELYGVADPTALTPVFTLATAPSPAVENGTNLATTFRSDLAVNASFRNDTGGLWDAGCISGHSYSLFDLFNGIADTPIYDRDPYVGPRWQRY